MRLACPQEVVECSLDQTYERNPRVEVPQRAHTQIHHCHTVLKRLPHNRRSQCTAYLVLQGLSGQMQRNDSPLNRSQGWVPAVGGEGTGAACLNSYPLYSPSFACCLHNVAVDCSTSFASSMRITSPIWFTVHSSALAQHLHMRVDLYTL
jgi:hypothetical protein